MPETIYAEIKRIQELEHKEDLLDQKKQIANEKSRFTAAFVNGIAISLFAVGLFGSVATVRAIQNMTGDAITTNFVLFALCILASILVHFAARNYVGGNR